MRLSSEETHWKILKDFQDMTRIVSDGNKQLREVNENLKKVLKEDDKWRERQTQKALKKRLGLR